MAGTLFSRFESWRDSLISRPAMSRLDRWTTPHTHPGTSASRVVVMKLRVLVVFLLRRLAQGGGRRAALRVTRSLRGEGGGKTVLVVGSGPSALSLKAKSVAKGQSAGEVVVVATNFFLASDIARTITPDYLVWSDDIFHPRNREKNRESWDALTAHPTITLVSPWTWKKDIEAMALPHRVSYFDDDTLEGWSRNISPLKPRGYQGSTGQKAIAYAVHLGGEPTAIIGIDLSYFRHFTVDSANRLYRHPVHVDGTDTGVAELTPHTLVGLADELYSTANNFRYLHTHFARFPIINLDPDSLVDAFPKVTDSPWVTKRT